MPHSLAYQDWLALVAALLASPRLVGYYDAVYPWQKAHARGVEPPAAVGEMWATLNRLYDVESA